MRRRLTILFVMMFVTTLAFAQSANLQVSRIMDGKIVPVNRMVVTKVRGRTLSRYKLNYYRSARFKATTAEERLCLSAINDDKEKAQSSVARNARGKSSIAFMLLPEHGQNRFISYVTQKAGKDKYKVTVIYMEGSVSSLHELETLINK